MRDMSFVLVVLVVGLFPVSSLYAEGPLHSGDPFLDGVVERPPGRDRPMLADVRFPAELSAGSHIAGGGAVAFYDDFEDGVLNPFWTSYSDVPGAEITEADGTLSVMIPEEVDAFLDAGLESVNACPLQSFEASVDFRVPGGGVDWHRPMAWLKARTDPTNGTHSTWGVYLYDSYHAWLTNEDESRLRYTVPRFGDESESWHTLKIVYDADSMTAEAYVDDVFIGSETVNLDNFHIHIFTKAGPYWEDPPAVTEFDNFRLVLTQDTHTIRGHVGYDDDGQQGDVAGIPVYVYQEGVALPVWRGMTDDQGRYEVDSFNINYSRTGSQRFRVEAKWEDELTRIQRTTRFFEGICLGEDVRGWAPANRSFAERGDFDIVIAGDDSLQLHRDANDVFCAVHAAHECVYQHFSYMMPQVTVYILAPQGQPEQQFSVTGDIVCRRCSLSQGRLHKYKTWHEYGHYVHYQHTLPYGKESVAEGWAIYFSHFAWPDVVNEEDYDISLYDTGDEVHDWGSLYADIFYDISDKKQSPDSEPDIDDDEIDGDNTGCHDRNGNPITGEFMVWTVIMGDRVSDINDFYLKFVERYGRLQAALDGIYRSHGLTPPGSTIASGQMLPSGAVTTTTMIDSTVAQSTFSVSWPGSDLDLTLTSPSGVTIDPAYAERDPDVIYVEEATQEYYRLEHPEPGQWQMHVMAIDVPPEGETYTATVSLTTNLILMLSTDRETCVPGEPILLTARLLYDVNLYAGAGVETRVETPETTEEMTLYDDGLHNDADSGDGIYANMFAKTVAEGQYTITATASGLNPYGEPFVRQTTRTVLVRSLPDLVPTDLAMDLGPVEGQATLSAQVLNAGTNDANGILVAFYRVDEVNAVQIGGDIAIDRLSPGEARGVSVVWNIPRGTHKVFVVVDYLNAVPETDETNNILSGAFSVDPQPVAHWRFDDGGGTQASDSAGANPGDVHGADWVEGKIAGALRFDGVEDYVDCKNSAFLAPEIATITFWMCIESGTSRQYVLGKTKDLESELDYMFHTDGDGKLQWCFGGDPSKQVVVRSKTALPLGQWVHVAASRDGAAASLYLNGQLDSSTVYSFVPKAGNQALRIGSVGSADGWTGYFEGMIDDVRIYDQALSAQEVRELFDRP